MLDSISFSQSSTYLHGHVSVYTDATGADQAIYLGYSLPLSKSELFLLKTLLLSLPSCPSSKELSEATGISVEQISVLVNKINRKAFAIGGRKLILGTSHHGFRFYEFM